MKNILLVLLLCLLAACAGKNDEPSVAVPQPLCETAYVLLPDNFIIDLAAGAEVALNPAFQQFALFCSPEAAQDTLAANLRQGRLKTTGQWTVYMLEGRFADLAIPCGDGQFCLGIPATVRDWIPPTTENSARE